MITTVDVKKCLQNHSQNVISIIIHQIREHELVTSVEDYNVLMLTPCRFVDCHVNVGDNNLERFCKCFFESTVLNTYT